MNPVVFTADFFLSFSEVKNIFLGVLWKLLVNIWSFFSLSNDSLKAEFCCIVHILHYSGWISGQIVFCFVLFFFPEQTGSYLFCSVSWVWQDKDSHTHSHTQTHKRPFTLGMWGIWGVRCWGGGIPSHQYSAACFAKTSSQCCVASQRIQAVGNYMKIFYGPLSESQF